ncbi:hypothetical protein VPHK469_0139 [Vibrio phage K469]
MLQVIHNQNVEALEWAQANHNMVHVIVVLGVDNELFENVAQPMADFTTQMPMAEDTFLNVIRLSLGGSACKYSSTDEKTGDIVYDVSLGGKAFFGNIPAGHIIGIAAGSHEEDLMPVPTPIGVNYVLNGTEMPKKAPAAVSRPAEAPKRQAFKPTLVK